MAHWFREKVVAKIYEAYDDFIAKGSKAVLRADGKYKLSGFAKEGLEIEMFFTKKGNMTSAYPLVKVLV